MNPTPAAHAKIAGREHGSTKIPDLATLCHCASGSPLRRS
jgi:hypothetical protein